MAMFGELVYESSRAFADDEEEESQNQTGLSFEIEHTSEGHKLLDGGLSIADLVFCGFVGKVALGFGDGFVSNSNESANFLPLASIFMVGQAENVVDMYLNRPKKKAIAQLFYSSGTGTGDKSKSSPSLFALFNMHGVPRYLTNEVIQTMEAYLKLCKKLLVLHSDTMAYYQSEVNCENKVFYVSSSTFPKKELPSLALPLPPPNVIGGVSAAVLTFGEMFDIPALLLATYGETEIVDSISLKPFSNLIKKGQGQTGSGCGYFSNLFTLLGGSIEKSLKKGSNVNPVAISNLYI